MLATGSTNNYFGAPQLAEHTIGMKTLAEAMRLRNHVLSCLERAAQTPSPEERAAWLTFVVAGGGPTGVEYAGALAELLQLVLGTDYPELRPSDTRIFLVEGLDRLLGAFHPKLGGYAEETLRSLGVEVRTGTLVDKADDRSVILSNGDAIATRTVVWSAGVQPESSKPGAAPSVWRKELNWRFSRRLAGSAMTGLLRTPRLAKPGVL